jgi:hypothetical protein
MTKLLTEQRLCELAGITEADTVDMYKSKIDARKRARHSAEKEFFGSDRDPLVTTDVPLPPESDPNATQELTPDQVAQIQKDVPDEARRPVAMELYKALLEPNYTEDEIDFLVNQNDDVADALSQIIGWFHPAFHDSRGMPTYDNPSRLGVKVAQEFAEEGLDPVQDAEEFSQRLERYLHDEARGEFAANVGSRKDAQNVKQGQAAIPGTPAHTALQNLFKKIDAEDEFGQATTQGRIRNKS